MVLISSEPNLYGGTMVIVLKFVCYCINDDHQRFNVRYSLFTAYFLQETALRYGVHWDEIQLAIYSSRIYDFCDVLFSMFFDTYTEFCSGDSDSTTAEKRTLC